MRGERHNGMVLCEHRERAPDERLFLLRCERHCREEGEFSEVVAS